MCVNLYISILSSKNYKYAEFGSFVNIIMHNPFKKVALSRYAC